jgi:uncharacterized protein involved in response to NO
MDATHRLTQAPLWRREPYRTLFPLGVLLAWAGVLHWLLHAVGLLANYEPVFHSIAQIQGFMMCFAVGFLFTAIPRRTGTGPPAAWEMIVGLLAPIGTTIAAWYERWTISQAFWITLVLVLVRFAVRRFLSAEAARRPPNSFIWVPLSLAMGVGGSVLIAAGGILGGAYFRLHDLGRLFLLQGMFIGLVVGVGGMVLPLVTRGEAPPDAAATWRDHGVRACHLAAAVVLAASFWIETAVSQVGGLALRAAVTLLVLLVSGRIYRLPTLPGWHRRLVWLSAWMIPAGYILASLFPLQVKAGLHVVFIGGFALMALSVGLHVTLAHGGYTRLVSARPWQVPVYGGLLLAAMVLRALCDFDPQRFFLWLGCGAACFLLASIAWGSVVVPRLIREPRPDEVL